MPKNTQTTVEGRATALEDRLPELLDETLGRLEAVGVGRILELAEAMARADVDRPADAHLVPADEQTN